MVDLDNGHGTVKALKVNVNTAGDKTQLSIRPERVTIDSINPISWKKTAKLIIGEFVSNAEKRMFLDL